MQTIVSRTYTNVALTVILLLLLALVVQPYVAIPQAGAQSQLTDSKTIKRDTTVNPEVEGASATREVASALKDVASALREQAVAQKEIGRALFKLSSDATVVTK